MSDHFRAFYLALARYGAERDTEEYIKRPVRNGPGVFLCFSNVRPELLRGVLGGAWKQIVDFINEQKYPF